MSSKNHLHLYKRVNLSRKKDSPFVVFACQDGCTHYIQIALAIGRKARCWRCDKAFTMDSTSVKLARPHCEDCTFGREKEKKEEVRQQFDVDKMLEDLSVKR